MHLANNLQTTTDALVGVTLSQRSNIQHQYPSGIHINSAMEGGDRKMIKPSHSMENGPGIRCHFRALRRHSTKLSDLALINHACYHGLLGSWLMACVGGIPSPLLNIIPENCLRRRPWAGMAGMAGSCAVSARATP